MSAAVSVSLTNRRASGGGVAFVHAASAGILLAILGGIAFFLFPEGEASRRHERGLHGLYRLCGVMIWLSCAAALLLALKFPGVARDDHTLFFCETTMLLFFSVSWLAKGEVLRATAATARKLKTGPPAVPVGHPPAGGPVDPRVA